MTSFPRGRSLCAMILFAGGIGANAAEPAVNDQPRSNTAATSQPAGAGSTTEKQEAKKPSGFYNPSKAWGSRIELSQPPAYVRTLDKIGLPNLEDYKWLQLGAEHRTRWEYRDDDYRRSPVLDDDNQFLLRSRGYLGVTEILDPFRLGFEFMDARQFNSDFPENVSDVNAHDVLQLFGELYFEDALGEGQPLRLQAGRMTWDYVDRLLVARNRWRNTVNAFDGFRVQFGEQSSPWQVDMFAVQPVERFLVQLDHGDDERWFYGIVGAWRKWSKYITLEPYYFVLDEDRKGEVVADREIHTIGMHSYGLIGKTGFDWDVDTAFQFGDDGDKDQCAFAEYGEIGYTFQHDWKPRLSFGEGYASGDRDPDDNRTERFDRLFGHGHGWSIQDTFIWQNMIMTKLRLEFTPYKNVRIDTAYGAYWLASDSDAWSVPRRRDVTGRSGDCIGQEIDARIRCQIDPRAEIEMGYSHFMPGQFVDNTGPSDDSDFFYIQTTLQLFK